MKKRFSLGVAAFLYTMLSFVAAVLPAPTASAQAACPAVPTMKVSIQVPVSGKYALWLRATTGTQAPMSVGIKFDQEANCLNFKVPATGAFQWLGGTNGTLTRDLTVGAHDVYLMVDGGEIKADRLVVTGHTQCTPQGDGQNCLDQNVDIKVDGLIANQPIENLMQVATSLTGAELVSPKVEYYFDNSNTVYAARTKAPYCLFVTGDQCASGDVRFLGGGDHSLKIVITAANMETTTKRIPFRIDPQNPTPNPTPSPTPPPTPSPAAYPIPNSNPLTAPKPTTTVTPAKTNTVVVGTSVTGTTKTLTGQKSVTVAPSQPLTTGDKVSYAVNNKPVGSVTMGNEVTDPSVPVDLTNEKNGDATISATIDRADGSSETYGVKTKVDNSKVATTQSWFARTGVKLIATTISIVMAIVGGILIFRAIKQRREYAEMHNLDSYQYVQPQSDVGAYSLPPLAVLVFAAGAVFASLTGAEVARVGVVVDLTKASLPTEYSLVNDAAGNYIQMRSLEHSMPNPNPPAPTPNPNPPAPVDNASYAANLAMIKTLPSRNTKEDASPHKNTPSAQLYDKADLYGPYTAYMETRGAYWGDFWYDLAFFRTTAAGSFRASCEASHFAYDDPIVYPNQPGAAHLHMFIGNTDTNAYSTYDTILNSGGSTCNGGELNRTSYWVPAMFDGKGNVVVPTRIGFYYKTEGSAGIGKTKPYPEGLKMIADRSNNTQGNLDASTFRCNNMFNGAKSDPSATIPTCFSPPKNGAFVGALEMLIMFDYCWNGKTDTIGDWEANRGLNGKSANIVKPLNFWFSSNCPASHPIVLPNLVTHIFYDIKLDEDTSGWFLSSDVDRATGQISSAGRGASAHADWFGGWNRQIIQEWVDNCSNIQNAECGAGLLADPNNKPNPRALRQRNDWIAGVNNPKARIPLTEIYQHLCPGGKATISGAAPAAAYCQK